MTKRGAGASCYPTKSGDRAMTKPDTPFPKHWRYYIFIKWAVIVAAIILALKLVWEML
jgi:hypothetical protein